MSEEEFEWPATRELSHIDVTTAGVDCQYVDQWARRSLMVLGRRVWWRRLAGFNDAVLRRGSLLFCASTWHAYCYLRVGWRWVLVFDGARGGLAMNFWVGDVPDVVKAAVADAVWQLVKDAEREDRIQRSTRWNALAKAVEKP